MTKKDTLLAIRALGATARWDPAWGEYRVNLPAPYGTEATAYYTPDDEDAVGTARAMMAQHRALLGSVA